MAPSKSSRAHDDTKPDSATKEKNGGHTATKMRRGASQTSAAQHREPPAAVTSAPAQVLTDTAGPAVCPKLDHRPKHGQRALVLLIYTDNG